MPDLIPISFYDDTINTCKDEHIGKMYCIPREIAQRLGLNWSAQHQKLKGCLYQRYLRYENIPSRGGKQRAILLDIDYLPAWLSSISPEKVNENVRKWLLIYQEECAQALHHYWATGIAINPRSQDIPQRLPAPKVQISLFDQAHALLDYDIQRNPFRQRDETYVPKKQYVYLICEHRSQIFKIGVSSNPRHRLSSLQSANPNLLSLLHVWQVFHAYAIEHELHEMFSTTHQQGEWFALSAEQKAELIMYMKQYAESPLAG